MKALVKAHAKPGLWLQDVDKPAIGPEEVLIKINEVAIWGTDLHIYNWDQWAQEHGPVPMTVGHEYIGVIEEIGDLLGVTRERIRQIEAKALRKLRHPTRSRKLKNFIDT